MLEQKIGEMNTKINKKSKKKMNKHENTTNNPIFYIPIN